MRILKKIAQKIWYDFFEFIVMPFNLCNESINFKPS